MLKASIASVLALAAAMSLTGCNGKPQEAAKTDAAPTAAAPAGAAEMPANHPQARPTGEVDLTGILKAEGGKTVLDVYTDKAALANQKVVVRGKVVKTNAGIMNKDWVHIRDGSGEEGTNDLTVTTTSQPLPTYRRHGAGLGHGDPRQGFRHGLPVPRADRRRRGKDRNRSSEVSALTGWPDLRPSRRDTRPGTCPAFFSAIFWSGPAPRPPEGRVAQIRGGPVGPPLSVINSGGWRSARLAHLAHRAYLKYVHDPVDHLVDVVVPLQVVRSRRCSRPCPTCELKEASLASLSSLISTALWQPPQARDARTRPRAAAPCRPSLQGPRRRAGREIDPAVVHFRLRPTRGPATTWCCPAGYRSPAPSCWTSCGTLRSS